MGRGKAEWERLVESAGNTPIFLTPAVRRTRTLRRLDLSASFSRTPVGTTGGRVKRTYIRKVMNEKMIRKTPIAKIARTVQEEQVDPTDNVENDVEDPKLKGTVSVPMLKMKLFASIDGTKNAESLFEIDAAAIKHAYSKVSASPPNLQTGIESVKLQVPSTSAAALLQQKMEVGTAESKSAPEAPPSTAEANSGKLPMTVKRQSKMLNEDLSVKKMNLRFNGKGSMTRKTNVKSTEMAKKPFRCINKDSTGRDGKYVPGYMRGTISTAAKATLARTARFAHAEKGAEKKEKGKVNLNETFTAE